MAASAPARDPAPAPSLVLTARPLPLRQLLRRVWDARSLIATLARKDFFVRYRRASLGVLWAAGLPLVQAVVLAAVFSRVTNLHAPNNVSYGAFIFAGLVPWSFFSACIVAGSTCIVDNSTLLSRVYFPRMVMPLVTVLSASYGLCISIVLLLGMSLILGVHLGIQVLLLIPATALLLVVTTSAVLVTSALHVYFRDVRFIVQATMIALFYVTPVIYPLDAAGSGLRRALSVNPATGVVEAFRTATVGADGGALEAVIVSLVWAVVLATSGLLLHRSRDRVFADLL